jgi:hypothetical protein
MKPTRILFIIWRTQDKYLRGKIFSTDHWMSFCDVGSVRRLNEWLTGHVINTYAFSVRLYKLGLWLNLLSVLSTQPVQINTCLHTWLTSFAYCLFPYFLLQNTWKRLMLGWLPIAKPSEGSQIYGHEPYVVSYIFNFYKISSCKTGIWCLHIYYNADLFKDTLNKSEQCSCNSDKGSDKVFLV